MIIASQQVNKKINRYYTIYIIYGYSTVSGTQYESNSNFIDHKILATFPGISRNITESLTRFIL